MNEKEKRAWIAFPIALVLSALLTIAGSQNGYRVNNISVFWVCTIIVFFIQWLAFIPAYLRKTEKFYDLIGGLTYLTVIWTAVLIIGKFDDRSIILLLLVSIWAARLSLFLFRRVLRTGEDRRFKELKTSFPRFLLTWTMQGVWVIFTLAAALAALTTKNQNDLDFTSIIGIIIWIIGFTFEVVADLQKSKFRSNPENKDKYITSGLWSRSRHPNYFGEIVLWIGIAVIALPVLEGWALITLISPVFVYLLITKISGIPLLEASATKKWGETQYYEEYKVNTPVLFPRIFG